MELRSATLMETTVSLALLGTVLALATLIFSNVVQGDRSARRTMARLDAEALLDRVALNRTITNEPLKTEHGTATITWEALCCDLRSITVEVTDMDGEPLFEMDRTIPGPWYD